ncbi:MAG: hypothetical protein EOO40_06685 [Deltaproteobacteria bacterium]|nr:MAG: hypothetical protein EOO40_06685 [Deltaproteobacteria bacterium]
MSLSDGQNANFVVGQANFTSSGYGSSATSLSGPAGHPVQVGPWALQADRNNARLLAFAAEPQANGPAAAFVIGQATLTTSQYLAADSNTLTGPAYLAAEGNVWAVSDQSSNRVLIYNEPPQAANGFVSADIVVGQDGDFTGSNSNCGPNSLNRPSGVSLAGGRLIVADTGNSRVLIWNHRPSRSKRAPSPPDITLGQHNMASCEQPAHVSAGSFSSPVGVWSDGVRLVVSDQQDNRVLIWNHMPRFNQQAADVILGQSAVDVTDAAVSQTGLNSPLDVTSNGTQLFVADQYGARVLVWHSFPSVWGAPADVVLGQANFTANNPTTSASQMSYPFGVGIVAERLWVTDGNNHRMLIFVSQ